VIKLTISEDFLRDCILNTVELSLNNWDNHNRGSVRCYVNTIEKGVITDVYTLAFGETNDIMIYESKNQDVMVHEDYRDWFNPMEHEYNTWEEMEESDPDEFYQLVHDWRLDQIDYKLREVRYEHMFDIIDDIQRRFEREYSIELIVTL
jgi:hypothetical protein